MEKNLSPTLKKGCVAQAPFVIDPSMFPLFLASCILEEMLRLL